MALLSTHCRLCTEVLVGNGKLKLASEIEKHFSAKHPQEWDKYLLVKRNSKQLLIQAIGETETSVDTLITSNPNGVLSLEI